MDVLSYRIAWVDAVRFQSRLDRSKPLGIGAMCDLYDDRTMANPTSPGLLAGHAGRAGSLSVLWPHGASALLWCGDNPGSSGNSTFCTTDGSRAGGGVLEESGSNATTAAKSDRGQD